MSDTADAEWRKGDPIRYIQERTPEVPMPAYPGEWYDDMVPDTLDLAERAALGVNGLTCPADPDADYEVYWWVDFFRNPPVMVHGGAETDAFQWAKFMEALPLMRIMSGSELNEQVEQRWMQVLFQMIGPDGLAYVPLVGRPWARERYLFMLDPVWRASGRTTTVADESVTQYTLPTICGRLVGALAIHHSLDGNPIWREMAERTVDGLVRLAIDKGEYAYFAEGSFEPNAAVSPDAKMPIGLFSASVGCGRAMQGLAQCYRAIGYQPALDLARKLAVQVRDHAQFYGPGGEFLLDPVQPGDYFHGHTIGVLGIAEYALAAGDQEMMDFARLCYERGKAQGSSLVGFMRKPYYPTSEICEIADMLALALKLTEAGVGDYWDDVDRWVRNQFAEGQLMDADWIDRIYRPHGRFHSRTPVGPNETDEQVEEALRRIS